MHCRWWLLTSGDSALLSNPVTWLAPFLCVAVLKSYRALVSTLEVPAFG
jgi:hypothetical protein